MRTYRLARVYDLELMVQPVFLLACLGLSLLMAGLGAWVLHWPWSTALGAGLAFGVVHVLSVLLHDLGHAIAARRTAVRGHHLRVPRVLGTLAIRRMWSTGDAEHIQPTCTPAADVVRAARELNPEIEVLARTTYASEIAATRAAGARVVVSGEVEVALAMAEHLLGTLGATPEQLDLARAHARSALQPE